MCFLFPKISFLEDTEGKGVGWEWKMSPFAGFSHLGNVGRTVPLRRHWLCQSTSLQWSRPPPNPCPMRCIPDRQVNRNALVQICLQAIYAFQTQLFSSPQRIQEKSISLELRYFIEVEFVKFTFVLCYLLDKVTCRPNRRISLPCVNVGHHPLKCIKDLVKCP